MGQTGYYHQVSMGRYLTPKAPILSENRNYDYQIRLILVGDAGTGKTTLINRYVKDEKTMRQLDSSYQEDLPRKKILEKNKKMISLQIVDTAGQERYRSLTSSYYSNAHGCLIVFDVTRECTFENVHRWSREIHEYAPNGIRIVLVGTNCLSIKRQVSRERAENIASSIGLTYVEVSTQDNIDITGPFDKLIDIIIEDLERKSMLYRLKGKSEITESCVIS